VVQSASVLPSVLMCFIQPAKKSRAEVPTTKQRQRSVSRMRSSSKTRKNIGHHPASLWHLIVQDISSFSPRCYSAFEFGAALPSGATAACGLAQKQFQNRRGLAHFAESSEQNVPVPFSEAVLKRLLG